MPPSRIDADPSALAELLLARDPGGRWLLGLCGAPGSGKSTLAAALVAELDARRPGWAVVVPMDGFHLAASVIAADDRAERRGAPDTFDPGGLGALLARLRANRESVIYAPVYRREIEDPVAGAIPVARDRGLVVVEGNYLLLPEWRAVTGQLDEVWFVEAPDEQLRVERLIERHEQFGKTPEQARRHVYETDQANAALVAGSRFRADAILRWPRW